MNLHAMLLLIDTLLLQESGSSAIFYAARRGHEKVVETLAKHDKRTVDQTDKVLYVSQLLQAPAP